LKKRFLSLCLAFILSLNPLTVLAANETQEVTQPSNSSCTVTANIPDPNQYVVTVPIVMNILGRTLNINRIAVAMFLVIGTALSLLLAIADAYNMFVTHTAWMYRGVNTLSVLGLVSTYSFFTKGTIWKVVTMGIIINIMAWILAGLCLIISSFCCSQADFIIIGLCLLCTGVLWYIWKSVNKVN
jgi:hypothetical protein